MKTFPIEQLRRRYRREWLLIAVEEMDEATTTPLRGRLLAHSPHRDEIDRASIQYPNPALVVFSDDAFPQATRRPLYWMAEGPLAPSGPIIVYVELTGQRTVRTITMALDTGAILTMNSLTLSARL